MRAPLRRQAGPAVAAAGPLLPDAPGRLLRGDRQRARPGMALRRQPVACASSCAWARPSRCPTIPGLCGRPRKAKPILASPQRRAAQAKRTEGLRPAFEGRRSVVRRPKPRPDPCRPSPQLLETASSTVGHRRLALLKGPVRCALMSGLSRGRRRWPPWVCARVPGTNLSSALEAQPRIRYRLDCLDHSLSHHAVQRFLPDQPDSRPPPSVRRNVTPLLLRRPRHVPSPGRPPCASSTPKRCAPSCSRAPRSPA